MMEYLLTLGILLSGSPGFSDNQQCTNHITAAQIIVKEIKISEDNLNQCLNDYGKQYSAEDVQFICFGYYKTYKFWEETAVNFSEAIKRVCPST